MVCGTNHQYSNEAYHCIYKYFRYGPVPRIIHNWMIIYAIQKWTTRIIQNWMIIVFFCVLYRDKWTKIIQIWMISGYHEQIIQIWRSNIIHFWNQNIPQYLHIAYRNYPCSRLIQLNATARDWHNLSLRSLSIISNKTLQTDTVKAILFLTSKQPQRCLIIAEFPLTVCTRLSFLLPRTRTWEQG